MNATAIISALSLPPGDSLGAKVEVKLYGIDFSETEKGNKRTGKIGKQGQSYGEEAFQAPGIIATK